MEQKAILGGGCFWCIEAIYKSIKGVNSVISGYSGGDTESPTYKDICRGDTNHAEVIEITFDNEIVNYNEILEIFWEIHDPTTLNRQGADIGTQYRSVIFYLNDEQKSIAKKSKELAQKNFNEKIVTQIDKASIFYPAEEYHQNYFELNPCQGYCQVVIAPKVEKFQINYKNKLKDS